MKFHELEVIPNRKAIRVGRGISAGRGKTAGRGTKGQGSRKSGGVRPGFEGGQMPLYMRLPKLRGFTSKRIPASTVYTGQLDQIGKTSIDTNVLAKAGLIEHPHVRVKLIAKGNVANKLTVKLQSASTSAIAMLVKSGGTFEKVEQVKRPSKASKTQPSTESVKKK